MRNDASSALRLDEDLPSLESARSTRTRRFERGGEYASAGALALDDLTALDPEPTRPTSRTAAGRAYGTHRRGDAPVRSGYQPGRRTVAITGQTQQPRRRSQTSTAVMANPDRVALWAFLLAVFLVLMAVATAHA
jgi:hypothetical protein